MCLCQPAGDFFAPFLSFWVWPSKPQARFVFPQILWAGRSSSSQERFNFWKAPNIIWFPVWWIRWGCKFRNTIFGQIQGMPLRHQADLFGVARKLALKWIPRRLWEQFRWRTAPTGLYILWHVNTKVRESSHFFSCPSQIHIKKNAFGPKLYAYVCNKPTGFTNTWIY